LQPPRRWLARLLAADAVVHPEDVRRVVAPLDLEQPRVVRPPETVLPVRLEVIGLVHVTPGPRGESAQDVHGLADQVRAERGVLRVWLVARYPGKRVLL